jgi:thiamine pyrophosphate-dependent acetolactate synthase large subunit-like protein
MLIRRVTDKTAKAKKERRSSRREFLGGTATLAAGSLLGSAQLFGDTPIPSVRIPKAVTDSLAASPRRADFSGPGITGAQVFANLCMDEELAAMFCAAGNYTIINEIAQVGIPCYGGRTEGGMCSAADGFTRVTGEVAACSGTEGPGLTNMIMNIATAHYSNSPVLVLASNQSLKQEDNNRRIQFMYQQPTTEGIKKYGKRITVPNRVYEYGSYAFRNLKSGVPDVAHLDFPAEVANERFQDPSKLDCYFPKNQYRSESRACAGSKELNQAIDMINKSERPVLIAGHGVFVHKAWEPLMQVAEKHEMAVVGSGPVRGHFPDDHRLSGSMSNDALMSADLVVFVGQYLMPNPGEWTLPPGVKTIRVHPVQEDLGRNWPIDLGIVSDERLFLEALANGLPAKKRDSWIDEIAADKQKREKANLDLNEKYLKYSRDTNALHPFVLCKEVHDFLYKGNIDPKQTVTGWGGSMIGFCAMRWLRANRPGQEIPVVYQFGPMGPDLAMMMGAGVAVQRGIGPQAAYRGAPVVVVTGDMGMGYSLMELDTFAKYKIPVICIVYNNNASGSFTFALEMGTPRAEHLYLYQENIRYDQIAEKLGARGEYVRTPEDLRASLARSYDIAAKQNISTLINCQGIKDFNVGKLYPPGLGFAPEPGVGAMSH